MQRDKLGKFNKNISVTFVKSLENMSDSQVNEIIKEMQRAQDWAEESGKVTWLVWNPWGLAYHCTQVREVLKNQCEVSCHYPPNFNPYDPIFYFDSEESQKEYLENPDLL